MDLVRFKAAALRARTGAPVEIGEIDGIKVVIRAKKYTRREADEIRAAAMESSSDLPPGVIRMGARLHEKLGRNPTNAEIEAALSDDDFGALLKSKSDPGRADRIRCMTLRYGLAMVGIGEEETKAGEEIPDDVIDAIAEDTEILDKALAEVAALNPFSGPTTSSPSETSPRPPSDE